MRYLNIFIPKFDYFITDQTRVKILTANRAGIYFYPVTDDGVTKIRSK